MTSYYLKDNSPRVTITSLSFMNMTGCFLPLCILLSLLRIPFSFLWSQLILTFQDTLKWIFLCRVFTGIPLTPRGVKCLTFKFPKHSGHKSIIPNTQLLSNCKFTYLSLPLILNFLKVETQFHLSITRT